MDLGAGLVLVLVVRIDGVGLAVASARGRLPAPIVTVDPCLAAVGERACGPVILLEGVGRETDLLLPSEAEEAELLRRRRLRPDGSGGVVDREAGCEVAAPIRRAAGCPVRAGGPVALAGRECG